MPVTTPALTPPTPLTHLPSPNHHLPCPTVRVMLCVLTYRYKLPVIIIVVNNNGIYSGVDMDTWREIGKLGDLATV